jgi:hypothetical protein
VRVTEATEVSEQAPEAHINGSMSFDDVKEAVRKALEALIRSENGMEYCWVYIADLTSTDVVYAFAGDDLWQRSYTIDDNGTSRSVIRRRSCGRTQTRPADAPGDGQMATMMDAAAGEAFDAAEASACRSGCCRRRPVRAAVSYDSKSNTGTGYGSKNGDQRVLAAQKALNAAGFTDADGNKLKLDGKLGPKTTASIKAYQKAHGLKPDGKITPTLLAATEEGQARPRAARARAARRPQPGKKAKPQMPASVTQGAGGRGSEQSAISSSAGSWKPRVRTPTAAGSSAPGSSPTATPRTGAGTPRR